MDSIRGGKTVAVLSELIEMEVFYLFLSLLLFFLYSRIVAYLSLLYFCAIEN